MRTTARRCAKCARTSSMYWSITSGGSGSVGVSLLFSYNHEATRRSPKEHEDPRKNTTKAPRIEPHKARRRSTVVSRRHAHPTIDDGLQSTICNLRSALYFSAGSVSGSPRAVRRVVGRIAANTGRNKGVKYKSPERCGSCIDAFVPSSAPSAQPRRSVCGSVVKDHQLLVIF